MLDNNTRKALLEAVALVVAERGAITIDHTTELILGKRLPDQEVDSKA